MPNLRKWSTTATGNATIAGGTNTINWAEGQFPSTVNNSAREMAAQIRGVYKPNQWGWVEHSATNSVASQTVTKLAGDQTSDYTALRRVRFTGGSTTRYASIVSSSFTAETTITVRMDGSLTLSNSHSIIAVAASDANTIGDYLYFSSDKRLKFSEWRTQYSTDQLAFEAMLKQAFSASISQRIVDGEGMGCRIDNVCDVASATGKTSHTNFVRIENFNFYRASASATLTSTLTTKNCTGLPGSATLNVASNAGLFRGMLVEGVGIPRECYVTTVSGTTDILLNVPVFQSITAAQAITFSDVGYMLDFKGINTLQKMYISNNWFDCQGVASAIRLSYDGIGTFITGNRFNGVAMHAICDFYAGGSGVRIDGNDITMHASATASSVAITISSNDAKITNNRIPEAHHQIVMHGSGNLLVGNHVWGGKRAGIVFTNRNVKSVVTGNYIDTCWVELGDESDNAAAGNALSNLSIVGNVFTANLTATATASLHRFVNVYPHVANRTVSNFNVAGNVFRDLTNGMTRLDGIQRFSNSGTASCLFGISPLSMSRVTFQNNGIFGITNKTECPTTLSWTVSGSATTIWDVAFNLNLPWQARCRVESVVVRNLKRAGGTKVFEAPFVEDGADGLSSSQTVRLTFSASYSGIAIVRASVNDPEQAPA